MLIMLTSLIGIFLTLVRCLICTANIYWFPVAYFTRLKRHEMFLQAGHSSEEPWVDNIHPAFVALSHKNTLIHTQIHNKPAPDWNTYVLLNQQKGNGGHFSPHFCLCVLVSSHLHCLLGLVVEATGPEEKSRHPSPVWHSPASSWGTLEFPSQWTCNLYSEFWVCHW